MAKSEQSELAGKTMQFEIRCVPESEALWPMRSFATSIAREMGFADEEVDQIEMAVDEACANVIRHAYKHMGFSSDFAAGSSPSLAPGSEPPSIEDCFLLVRIHIAPDGLAFEIIDRGVGIETQPKGVEGIDEYVQRGGRGGLGIFIMREFMDEVAVEPRQGGGTVLRMAKKLKAAGA